MQKDYLMQQMRTVEMREHAERQRQMHAAFTAGNKSTSKWLKSMPWLGWLIDTIVPLR
jgi:hypothetical protein